MFSQEKIKELLPRERIEAFYFGEEPAYDLALALGAFDKERKFIRLELLT